MYRVVASQNSTVVSYSSNLGVPTTRSMRDSTWSSLRRKTISISATKPIAVAQYMMGQQYFTGTTTGDRQ
jgi:hypothetical protein